MLEEQVDLWDLTRYDVALCITTNGFVKKNGENVMGRGCALELKQRCPDFPKVFGNMINLVGNRLVVWESEEVPALNKLGYKHLITFPVKHNWWENADVELIKKSAIDLMALIDVSDITKVYLPRPGCGCGGLNWEKDVRPVLQPILDDRIIVVWK